MHALFDWIKWVLGLQPPSQKGLKQITISKANQEYVVRPTPLTQKSSRPVRIYNMTPDRIELKFVNTNDVPFTDKRRYILSDGEIETLKVRQHRGQRRYEYEIVALVEAEATAEKQVAVTPEGEAVPATNESKGQTTTRAFAIRRNPEMIID